LKHSKVKFCLQVLISLFRFWRLGQGLC